VDKATFTGCCLLGFPPALIVFYRLGARRRAWIPPLGWWLFLILGAVLCGYGLINSTTPSFAPRITGVGRIYDFVEQKHGGYTWFGFHFEPEDGRPVQLETHISLPHWGNSSVISARTYRIVYLYDSDRTVRNEAIDIEILSGDSTGFRNSLDARPGGRWLVIPIGATLGIFGYFGLRYMKDDADSAMNDEETDAVS
jgi:hypothetical protein